MNKKFDRAMSITQNKNPEHPGRLQLVSVLVPTKNEQENLADCLKSLTWADEIIVFDSFSSDKTCEIALQMGAQVIQRQFDNFAAHKNWALDNIAFKNSWVLIVDADERISPALADEISEVLKEDPAINGFYVARKNYFAGKWIRHGGWYPNWNLRLIRRGCGHYESRIVHEHVLLVGPAGFLKNPLVHHDYKGIERYFDRHNDYSSMEAVEVYRSLKRGLPEKSLGSSLLAKGPERRRFLKNMAYRYLPARPFFKFLWMFILHLGFLDGRAGFRYCMLHSFYEYQVSLKLKELMNPESTLYRKYQAYL